MGGRPNYEGHMDVIMQAVGGLLLQTMITKKAAGEVRPNLATEINSTVGIITFNKRDIRSPRYHAAVAASGAGDLAGAILNKRGDAACTFVGVYDVFTDCLDLFGCCESLFG